MIQTPQLLSIGLRYRKREDVSKSVEKLRERLEVADRGVQRRQATLECRISGADNTEQ